MKKYYYTDGVNDFGPFTLDELKGKPITKDTYVWFEGLAEWVLAADVQELYELFSSTPPPIRKPEPTTTYQQSTSNVQKPPKSWLVESILVTLFCCLPFGIVGIVNATRVESLFNAGDMAGANRAADDAKKWTIVSLCVGLGVYFIYIFYVIGAVALGVFSGL